MPALCPGLPSQPDHSVATVLSRQSPEPNEPIGGACFRAPQPLKESTWLKDTSA